MRRSLASAECRATLIILGVVFTAAMGCGTAAPPLFTGDGSNTPDSGMTGSTATGTLLQEAGSPPSCDGGTEEGICGCLDLTLLGNAPNLYFLLDRSGSMNDDGKWTTIRTVIADIMHRIGPRARFGAAVFPNPAAADDCAPGVQVMQMTLGDSPAGTYGPTTAAFSSATNYVAAGGTPTAATITSLQATLAALPGKTYVILATDGGPNCDANVTCDSSACISNIESDPGCAPSPAPNCCTTAPLNCLDSAATVQAVTTLAAAGILTYVVGVPGSGPYAGVLDQMALAGGTARPATPYYYQVSSTDETDFATTLSSVAAKITATCTLTLSAAPPDPTAVNVYLDGVVVPADPTNGWTISGATVTLQGDTCASVLAGNALSLRIIAGCPTVQP